MARLPWQHTRTRTKSGNEKNLLSNSQDWFNRHTSEPSRQAFNDLVKAHKRENSDDSMQSRSRSRANTVSSTDWHLNQSNQSNLSDLNESQRSREGSVYSSLDRTDTSSRSLLAKSGIKLRRSGSKMSLSSSASGSTLPITSPSRNAPNVTTREELRNKISAPFDFQHVTHTEQGQFAALARIDESLLASKFDAVTAQQAAGPTLRGIDAAEIRTQESGHAIAMDNTNVDSDAFQPQAIEENEAPPPPPKDDHPTDYLAASQSLPSRTRLNQNVPALPRNGFADKAVDVFLAANDTSTPLASARSHSSLIADEEGRDAKPLPHLPVIHAVTTEDDSAREMMCLPLPTPPVENSPSDGRPSPNVSIHQRQKSSIAMPRHFSFRPSAKMSMPNLLATESTGPSQGLPRHRSDMALAKQVKQPPMDDRSRMSMSFGAVDTVNWEDAVDEAWADADDDLIHTTLPQMTYQPLRKCASANLLDSLYGSDQNSSGTSTPLMVHAPTQPLPALPGISSSPIDGPAKFDHSPDLTGLGITSPATGPFNAVQMSRSSSIIRTQRRSSQYVRPDSTRSSSQESIILSIASSINGTQRSSNSSLTADDLLSTSKIEEETAADMEMLDSISKTRPESGCLPPDLYEPMSRAGIGSPSPDTTTTPPVPPIPSTTHKSNVSSSKISIPERGSSASTTEITRGTRKRSNTAGTRPRQSVRFSYSLFPAATSTAPSSTVPM